MTEKSIKRSDLTLPPAETDYLIGKWRLTDTLYVLPDNDLLPCDCDHRRLISLEFLPGNRFVEVSHDRRQQIVTHTGTYREAGEDILLYYDDLDGFDSLYLDKLNVAHLEPPELLMLAPQRLPLDLIALQFFLEGGRIDFTGVWTQTECHVRVAEGWVRQDYSPESLEVWDFSDPDNCTIQTRQADSQLREVGYSYEDGYLVITPIHTLRERYRIDPISAEEAWAYLCDDNDQDQPGFEHYRYKLSK